MDRQDRLYAVTRTRWRDLYGAGQAPTGFRRRTRPAERDLRDTAMNLDPTGSAQARRYPR